MDSFIIVCWLPLFVLGAGLLVAFRGALILHALPWRLVHHFRHAVDGTTTFSFGSKISVDKYEEENRFPSRRLECEKICGA